MPPTSSAGSSNLEKGVCEEVFDQIAREVLITQPSFERPAARAAGIAQAR
ncbi:hypothetical protein FHT77_003037 [Rhizobium sp. BK181]|nr:hypothetical protein [Rhizobium sp. BK181]